MNVVFSFLQGESNYTGEEFNMAEPTKTPRKPKFTKKDVILTGLVKFSTLKTAKGFQNSEDNKRFEIVITVDHADPQLKMLAAIHKEAIDFEFAQIVKAKQGKFMATSAPGDVDVDKDGAETGLITLKAKRPEAALRPNVYDSSGKLQDMHIIERGSEVQIQVTVSSYVMGNMIGTSMRLENVVIKVLAPSTFVPRAQGPDKPAFTFTPEMEKIFDSAESPF